MTLPAITLLPEPFCVSPDTSLLETLHLMLDRGVNHIPVCDGGVWAGLVHINDIINFRKIADRECPSGSRWSKDLVSWENDDPHRN